MASDYVQAARLNGIPERRVIIRHALRNALAPTVQVVALTVQWLVGGVVVVESVFSYPGLGQGLVQSVIAHDIPVVQALTLLIAAVYILLNLIADMLVIMLVPEAADDALSAAAATARFVRPRPRFARHLARAHRAGRRHRRPRDRVLRAAIRAAFAQRRDGPRVLGRIVRVAARHRLRGRGRAQPCAQTAAHSVHHLRRPVATLLGYLVGGTIGLVAGYRAGSSTRVLMRAMDVLLAFPPLIFLLLLGTGFGNSAVALVIGIAIVHVPSIARIIRTAALEISVRGYVEAAVARGDHVRVILRREILPNIARHDRCRRGTALHRLDPARRRGQLPRPRRRAAAGRLGADDLARTGRG